VSRVGSTINAEIVNSLITSGFNVKFVQATLVEITEAQLGEINALVIAN
jgi:hypothetical protein